MARLVAKGTHNHPRFKLGAILGSEAHDLRTLNFADFLNSDVQHPKKWDFDKGRKAFASHVWGNDQYGDCELAARANYINRIQRAETKRTPHFNDDDVIDLYKKMTGCEIPGDNNDSGMTTLDNLKQWRNGWTPDSLAGSEYTYSIDAYGFIDPSNESLLRLASYLFNGVLLGIWLPVTAQAQTEAGGPWDYVPSAGWEAEPGSWGGHAVLSKRYDDENIYVLTWGTEIRVTNAFVKEYVDEAYVAVESFRAWQTYKHVFDVSKLIQTMNDIGINVES